MITLIAARDRNSAIGKGNEIPWHVPEDLALFQRETVGGAIIMGRRTWESLPVHPLKGRLNIVVTSGAVVGCDVCVSSVAQAIEAAALAGRHRIYGIGGQSIYAEMLPIAHRLLLTEVDLKVDQPDAYFPHVDLSKWMQLRSSTLRDEAPRCVVNEMLRTVE